MPGQRDPEPGSTIGPFALNPDLAAVFINDRFANHEAQAKTRSHSAMHAGKRLEQLFLLTPGQTGTRVFHAKNHRLVLRVEADFDAPTARRELDRVGKQIV